MAEMDALQSKIIRQIEAYLTDVNVRYDYILAKYETENDGWIPVEQLSHLNKLSTYKYHTILDALCCKRSNIIELDLNEPVCVRRQRQPFVRASIDKHPNLNRTVVVNGLPRDAKYEEIMEFFNRFYPVDKIKMLPTSKTSSFFSGKVHVLFMKPRDALEFVQKSQAVPIIYVNDYVLQLCNGYTLVCKMLADCDDKVENGFVQRRQTLHFHNGHGFSHRLANNRPRVSFDTKISASNERPKIPAIANQAKPCLKSSTCATEQILFCQNSIKNKSYKVLEYESQSIVSNRFSYEFFVPNHVLQQTHKCVIVTALNPHCFTVQLTQDAVVFDKFQREINDFYNELDDDRYLITREQIHINLCVICADPKSTNNDRIWNRSQILEFDSTDNTVNLFYVDLGTWDEYVPISCLRHLIECFHRHPVVSLTCRLADISPINNDKNELTWTKDATDQFLAVIHQVSPEIEFISLEEDGCFETNLFVFNSGQYVCVNDYMIHIKKADATVKQSHKHSFNDRCSRIHPVVVLYNQLGEILKRSSSQSASIIANDLTKSSKFLVKLISIQINNIVQSKLPIIFICYRESIFVPDFNICVLLNSVESNIDIRMIEDYASTIKSTSVNLTRECNPDLYAQIDRFVRARSLNSIRLYTVDFVRHILGYYCFQIENVILALENAKYVLENSIDLSLWFAMDNELTVPFTNDTKLCETPSTSTIKKRLAFSNRLI